MMNNKVVIEVPRSKEYVPVVRMAVCAYTNSIGVSINKMEDIKLAVSEACNNIVLHSPSSECSYTVRMEVREEVLYIELLDSIGSFVLEEYSEPNLDITNEGGFGVYIIRSLADSFDVFKSAVGQTMVMTFSL